MVVSEPLDRNLTDWCVIPPGSFAEITADEVTISPFRPSAAVSVSAA